MYGALADVLGMESEATDRQRAAYCLERYTQMLEMMKGSNWLLQTFINQAVSGATSLAEMDSLAVGWRRVAAESPRARYRPVSTSSLRFRGAAIW